VVLCCCFVSLSNHSPLFPMNPPQTNTTTPPPPLIPQQLKVLVEEAGADMNVTDRWGSTPLDEAKRVGATVVVSYLQLQEGWQSSSQPPQQSAARDQEGRGRMPEEGVQEGQEEEEE